MAIIKIHADCLKGQDPKRTQTNIFTILLYSLFLKTITRNLSK